MLWKLAIGVAVGLAVGSLFGWVFSFLFADLSQPSWPGWAAWGMVLSGAIAGGAGAASVRSSLPDRLLEWIKSLADRLQAEFVYPILLAALFVILALGLSSKVQIDGWLIFGILTLFTILVGFCLKWKPTLRAIQPPMGLTMKQADYEQLLPYAVMVFAKEVHLLAIYGPKTLTTLKLTVAQVVVYHPAYATAPGLPAGASHEIAQVGPPSTLAQLSAQYGGLPESLLAALQNYASVWA